MHMFGKKDWDEDKELLDMIAKVLAEEKHQLGEFFKNLTDIRSMIENEIVQSKIKMLEWLGELKT